jgi:hypothetical protein
MGNSSSSTSSSSGSSGEFGTDSHGVSLSERFQKDILEDFQATLEKQARGIQQQQQRHIQANTDLVQRHAQFLKEKQAVLSAGDQKWDALSTRFETQIKQTDAVASKLQDQYCVKSPEVGNHFSIIYYIYCNREGAYVSVCVMVGCFHFVSR